MSRGDQRERDRAKRQAKEAGSGGDKREGSKAQRNLEDAEKLRAKLAAKEAKKAEEAANGGVAQSKAPVPKKKKNAKKTENVDDLLSAGLSTKKKSNKKQCMFIFCYDSLENWNRSLFLLPRTATLFSLQGKQ